MVSILICTLQSLMPRHEFPLAFLPPLARLLVAVDSGEGHFLFLFSLIVSQNGGSSAAQASSSTPAVLGLASARLLLLFVPFILSSPRLGQQKHAAPVPQNHLWHLIENYKQNVVKCPVMGP